MADPRKVGHAIRRRMNASSSHMSMAERGTSERGIWHPPGPQPGQGSANIAGVAAAGGRSMGASHIKGVPDSYDTGTDTYGRGESPLASDNAAFASGVKAGVQAESTRPRGRLPAGESAGARLTVSPSMKMPEQSPVPTQGGGMVVPSQPSRSTSFSTGQSEIYRG